MTSAAGQDLRIAEYGDSALLVSASSPDPERRWSIAQGLASSLWSLRPPGLVDVVASYADVLVSFDPVVTDHDEMRSAVWNASAAPLTPRSPRRFDVPVVYGGEHGPDLDDVADELGITAPDVVAMHCAEPWVVRFLGAPVGAPMMDGGRMLAPVARRPEPRTRVAPGSVAVSGLQSVVYPVSSPGGWRLIGRTPLRLADVERDPIVPYRPGDIVRFVPIEESAWARWDGALADLATGSRTDE